MNRILTKYNITNLSADNPLSVTYALNERCKMIPESVSLAYFVKVLCKENFQNCGQNQRHELFSLAL